jgi:anti-sigma factor RsiW
MNTPSQTHDPHERAQDGFSAYVEGQLGAAEKAAIDAHLLSCAPCRAHLQRFNETLGSLGMLKRKAPDSFLTDIQRQIFTRSRGRFFGRRWMLFGRIPFEWVSLAMIVAMLVYYVVASQSSPTSVAPGP